jgi:hypothetical protein
MAIPALATTWSMVLEGVIEAAVRKRLTWSFQFVTSQWTNFIMKMLLELFETGHDAKMKKLAYPGN